MHKPENLGLYWRTIIYLKPAQIYSRLGVLFRKKILYRSEVFLKWRYKRRIKSEEFDLCFLNFGPKEVHCLLGRNDRLALDKPENIHAFTFLNKSMEFRDRVDWEPRGTTLLWQYNLHYFDYAYDLGVAYLDSNDEQIYKRFRTLVLNWIEDNHIARTIGWDPYPTSLRIANWIKAFHLFAKGLDSDPEFRRVLLKELYIQTLFLRDNVEYHLLNNHIIENGRALLLSGLFFGNKEAEIWREKGEKILWKELQRQVADDGGQFELSPMYHTVVMLNYIESATVLRSCKITVPEWVDVSIRRMLRYLHLICHPDGEIALLNDAASGMTTSTQKVLEACRLLGYRWEHEQAGESVEFNPLSDSGYYIIHANKHRSFFVFDCGELGPDFQPGHGHCDTLSYEWSYKGERIVVDSGVDDYYRQDKWRSYYRSTRAHNTIMIDGREQSEIWGNFRVGRRVRTLPAKWELNSNLIFIQGEHDGYRRLHGRVKHKRSVALVDSLFLIIFDEILGTGKHMVESFIHFHPQFILRQISNGSVRLSSSNNEFAVLPFGPEVFIKTYRGEEDKLQGWYAPEFGKRFSCETLSLYKTTELPFRFGYCLVPDTENNGCLTWQSTSTLMGYRLKLQVEKKTYFIECSSSGIRCR